MDKDTFLKEFGERVRELRNKKGYSQDELAKKCGYETRSAINKIEKGINDPSQTIIMKLARALDTTPQYLMGWDNSEPSAHKAYYENPETAEIAQEVFDNPDMRLLFDAARDSKPEDLRMAADMLKRFKGDD